MCKALIRTRVTSRRTVSYQYIRRRRDGAYHTMAKFVRGNRLCFTVNNYSSGEYQDFVDFCVNSTKNDGKGIAYACVGKELGKKAETPHLQGFVHLAGDSAEGRKRGIRFWKAIPGLARAHLEVARGTDQNNRDYCSKEGSFEEWGTPQQTQASIYAEIVEKIQTESLPDIIRQYPEASCKHYTNIRAMAREFSSDVQLDFPESLRNWQVSYNA